MAKVIVGMSGGVDSAVAAHLLKQAGYDVVGVTLRTWDADHGQESRCCEIDDARQAARAIGIPYHTFNCISDFQKHVTEPFVREYLRGRTPNPCVVCNRHVKWGRMLLIAKILQADHIATGHYACVQRLENGRFTVRRALHTGKDQTYMLYRLTQEQLAATLMPLGAYTKQQVRQIAQSAGLPIAEKPESQDICFISDGDYAGYIERCADAPVPGPFVDAGGAVLGTHRGIIRYTVGQRRGLGLALGYPAYVTKIRPGRNEIVVGPEADLFCGSFTCTDLNFLSIPGMQRGETLRCTAKVRYRHPGQSARIEMIGDDLLRVTMEAPVRTVTPGQSAVFYDDGDRVIGGGVIADTF